ncbi:MAG: hypothetical protein E7261_02405 [Lachnospiraceae bacterium]|nr:hypothetical protein [Lachnospiraceae bacterium]
MKRNNISGKIMTYLLLGVFSITSLNGCALLPPEDANRTVPTVSSQTKKEYTMEVVTRTNITDSKTFSCNYSETESIDLSFAISGKHFGKVYVSKGSKVLEGDLLATLETGTLENDILQLEEAIAANEKSLLQSQELMNLEIEKVNTKYKYGMISTTQKESELERINASYKNTTNKLEETLRLEYLEYNTLTKKLESYCIYAPMDGVITYVSSEFGNADKISSQGKTMISIADDSECVFQAKTNYASYYKDGDIITMTMSNGSGVYEAIVELSTENENILYLHPTEEIDGLTVGARAYIVLTLDSRENVLAVSNEAIRDATDFQYVYYINPDGIRDIKIVETGLVGDGMTEIISGLEFGEAIIKK